ncbi:uncharacterized protein E0L32_009223 [Thyridium curvatum]|uniref:Importin N-terminal domain-containing protein n=1 Tax=Thyridium curvatum TaxID=1093900 RepID=A0A507AJK9_9PEZI|nr:uncharacterized protein E0L32_009223 [Thyridium curvatum]TPX09622.1 hypothetical protein E0L32_009223 [Thyridium curvatum]
MAAVTSDGAGGRALAGPPSSSLGDGATTARIYDALELIYNPQSTNQDRKDAQIFLEEVKTTSQAPSIGFELASAPANSPIIRHYGLSLLEDAIKHKWAGYTEDQVVLLRRWVLQLAENVSRDDPLFLRTKVGLLWVEVAKRCWAAEWMDMDKLLMQLWQLPGSLVHKELVLSVLEMLSDEVFTGDDAVVALREGVLSKACVDIFTPSAVLSEAFPNRQLGPNVRFNDDGWLDRVSRLLGDCLDGDVQTNDDVRSCALKSLSVIYSLMPWAIPKAIVASRCVPLMCRALAAPHVAVQKASLEALHALYSRSNFTDEEFTDLVVPMYDPEFIDLCTRLFEWSTVDAEDIDDDKYQFAKKFSEMMSCLGNYLERKFSSLPANLEVPRFLELLLRVVQSQSLVVSIPVLVTWTRFLSNRALGSSIADTPLIGPLLEVCSARLIRYESLPEDTQDPTYLLLFEDTDTIPERHAFLGNYRRYSSQVIESVVQLKLVDATRHILGQADHVLEHLYDGQPPLDVARYNKNSMPALRVDAQFTVIESALKGFARWKASMNREAGPDVDQKSKMEADFESWCNRLLDMPVEDPAIRKRILQLLVAFSTTALDRNAGFMLKVLEHILLTWPAPQPEHKLFNDAIKDLQSESMVELQRLASKMPDHLLDVYDQLEAKVNDMIASGTLDSKRKIAYQSFLFIIVHRASRMEEGDRLRRLHSFVDPVVAQWKNEEFKRQLASYGGFCGLMALDRAQSYLARKRIHKIADWGSVELDGEGLALQSELEERQTLLPLRATKSFLTYSVEKLDKDSSPYLASCELWRDAFADILPQLLQFLSHAHATHNPANWTLLPADMHAVVGQVLTDRFWQAGISEGSKDDFYARVLDKKGTLEGLASTIRGTVRFVRETCYAVLYCMSRLDVHFYGFNELPGPLAHALFADSFCLSAHQIINLLNLVRYLVDHCPVALRDHFLPPLLATCFQQMDSKIKSEWDKLDRQQGVQSDGEALTEEMKAESILRQLTYTAVVMVADFLDPARTSETRPPPRHSVLAANHVCADPPAEPASGRHPSLRKFCLMQSSIVEPLLVFLMHAISMHDGRCCGVVLRVFRSIVPEFTGGAATAGNPPSDQPVSGSARPLEPLDGFPIPAETASAIREFISSDVLKACIESLHEPYFVDLQKELGSLIAFILVYYAPLSTTPASVLLSLPTIKPEDVRQTIEYVGRPGLHTRQQRAIVLDLLKDLKGVSISEQGRLSKTNGFKGEAGRSAKKTSRSKMAQAFMTAPGPTPSGAAGFGSGEAGGPSAAATRQSPDLEGVAGLFNTGQ